VIQDVTEYIVIADDAEQPEFESLWGRVDQMLDDQFVNTSGVTGVSKWESILNIKPKGTDSLEARRFRILTRLNEKLPYTLRMLESMLTTLCGEGQFSLDRDVLARKITIRIGLAARENFEDVAALLQKVIPANMIIDLELKYNRHEMWSQYTHAQLAAYTHYQLRNEVLA
jgi:hypothetical protein